MANTSNYTEEVKDLIVSAIRKGAKNKDACLMAGVAESTYYEWLREKERDGSDNKNYKSDLAEAIKKAEAERRTAMANRILIASDTSWQAAAWYLERTDFETYGRKDTVKHEGDAVSGITVKIIDANTTESDKGISEELPNE